MNFNYASQPIRVTPVLKVSEETHRQFKDLKAFLKKYQISQNFIAKKIGMNPNTFRLKFCNGHSFCFTHEEFIKIVKVLEEMWFDMKPALTYDWELREPELAKEMRQKDGRPSII